MRLDPFDIRIIEILTEEGRLTWTELAERVGLSATPTIRRVKALEAAGVIAGYRAVIDEVRAGSPMTLFVSVTLERQTDEQLNSFEKSVAGIPEVMDCYMMTGISDFLLRALLPDLSSLQSFLSELTKLQGVSRISSSFAVKRILNRSAPPLH
jgi:DNA-binding Lrp family transcriptional regulator